MTSASSAPPLVVRRAGPSDARALATFAATAFADTFAADNTPDDMASYLADAFDESRQRAELLDPDCIVLLAERGSDLAGYAMLRDGSAPHAASGIRSGNTIEIARLYADKRWIGTGVGATLMQACLDTGVERGREWIWLGVWERNARAIAFYARWRFTDVGSQFFQLGADRQTDRIMARPLAAQE